MTRTLFGLKKIPTNNLLEQWEFYFICTFHTIILHFKPASLVLLCPHIDISSGPNLSLTTEKWPKALHPEKMRQALDFMPRYSVYYGDYYCPNKTCKQLEGWEKQLTLDRDLI